MINIEFDERSVFTFDSDDLSVGVWDHRDGWLDGPIHSRMIGKIKFSRMEQAELFQEMLEIMTRSYFERREKFKEDGSCTDKCKWGYGIVIDTGLCIALDECRKEFKKEE